jgi:hypothetical protein
MFAQYFKTLLLKIVCVCVYIYALFNFNTVQTKCYIIMYQF